MTRGMILFFCAGCRHLCLFQYFTYPKAVFEYALDINRRSIFEKMELFEMVLAYVEKFWGDYE